MTINYNKWGVVTGIVGLVFLLTSSLPLLLSYFLNSLGMLMFSGLAGIFLGLPSLLLGIITIIFGFLSLTKGNNKKMALIFGIIYFILLIPAIILAHAMGVL